MYARIIGISFLICFGLQASNRDQWQIYPYIQEKIDEILKITGRENHDKNKLFALFKLNKSGELLLKAHYGPTISEPFINIKEEDGYEVIINNKAVKSILIEIQNHLVQNLSSFEKKRITMGCKASPNGVNISGFHSPSKKERELIAQYQKEEIVQYWKGILKNLEK